MHPSRALYRRIRQDHWNHARRLRVQFEETNASCSSVWKLNAPNQRRMRITKDSLRDRLQALIRRAWDFATRRERRQ